jgi:NAD(P)-dependent dehydrogenase (short-subunit alcohol dehydrogenase family)
MDIADASAIVTGGGSGIGAASARALTRLGARCVIVDRDEEAGKRVAEEIGGFFAQADVADAEAVQAAVDAAVKIGQLRVLVNAAGVGSSSRTVDRQGEPLALTAFEKVIRINLIGSFNCLRLSAAAMAKTDPVDASGSRGAIVNLGSGPRAEAFKAHLGESVLFPQRLGTADELASMVVELIKNDYVNGETIRVDGGIRMPPK